MIEIEDIPIIELSVKTNQYGLLLTKGNNTYSINKSNKAGAKYSPYYLKQLYPKRQYMTGLFKDKGKQVYRGTINHAKLTITVDEATQTATMKFS